MSLFGYGGALRLKKMTSSEDDYNYIVLQFSCIYLTAIHRNSNLTASLYCKVKLFNSSSDSGEEELVFFTGKISDSSSQRSHVINAADGHTVAVNMLQKSY